MKNFKTLCLMLVLIAIASVVQTVQAQDVYYFNVERMKVAVSINPDGSADIEYEWKFNNHSSAGPIEYVDVGLPNNDFSISNASAAIDGSAVPSTHLSTINNGVTIYLAGDAIPAGRSGIVNFKIAGVKNLLYEAKVEKTEPYAHFSFIPQWFGSDYVYGSTTVEVYLILPSGMTESEPVYDTPRNWPGSDTPEAWFQDGKVVYYWSSASGSGDGQYTFGASFPSRMVVDGAVQKAPFIYLTSADWEGIIPVVCLALCGGFIVFVVVASQKAARKRKLQYMPPKIALEGLGVKRGLTAVEAGVLMEQPLDKILQMILFSVIKKNAATVVTQDPLSLSIPSPIPEGLQPYELEFLAAFSKKTGRERQLGLQEMMINIVKSVTEKMKGFSRKESIAYYEDVMKRAWQQVEQAQTPEVKSQVYEQVMDWAMLDRQSDQRTQQTFGTGPVFVPVWWPRYDPSYRSAATGTNLLGKAGTSSPPSLSSARSTSAINMPTLPGATFAAGITKGAQTFSSGVVGNLTDFTSKITSKTNPVPVTTVSSSSRGGFGGGSSGGGRSSCACACACAGCACACAGGGR